MGVVWGKGRKRGCVGAGGVGRGYGSGWGRFVGEGLGVFGGVFGVLWGVWCGLLGGFWGSRRVFTPDGNDKHQFPGLPLIIREKLQELIYRTLGTTLFKPLVKTPLCRSHEAS